MNYTVPSKKLIIFNVLDVLKKYSDANHRLSQKDIESLLLRDYSMKIDRKTIKRSLLNLIDFGYEIEYTEIKRNGKNGDSTILTDWYLERDFTDAELRLLIDSLLFSKSIPYNQCKQLITKLEGLSNKFFSSNAKHIRNLPENSLGNPELFYTIEVLNEAIEKNKQVEFSLNYISSEKKRIISTDDNGNVKRYTFNPYQMAATNGRYYLIGNFDYYDNVAYVRIDHISNIECLNNKAKAKKYVKGLENGLNLPKHMAEHIYMFYGDTVPVLFKCPKNMSDQIADWFGMDFKVIKDEDDSITVSVNVNVRAMRFWALQYGTFVEVLEPESLRSEIKKSIYKMVDKYEKQ